MTNPTRTVICDDATKWLAQQDTIEAIITGPPELAEFGDDYTQWHSHYFIWLVLMMQRVQTYLIVFATDRKTSGVWIDKSAIMQQAAQQVGMMCLWHKLYLRRDVGATDVHRPTYTHMLCFSRMNRPGAPWADVLPVGHMVHRDGMNVDATQRCIQFIQDNAKKVKTITDPFCGQGTVLAIANRMGLNAVGVDINKVNCAKARKLNIVPGRKAKTLVE